MTNMKNIFKIFIIACISVCALSCKSDEEQKSSSILAEKDLITVSGEATSLSVNVTASGSWQASSDAEWCKAVKAQSAVTIIVERNDGPNMRTATVTLKCSEAEATITVNQNVTASSVSVSPAEFIIDAAPQSISFNVNSDTQWKITCAEDDDWYEISPTEGSGNQTVSVTVAQNEVAELRTAVATLSYTDRASNQEKSLSITIQQKAVRAQLSLSQTQLNVPHTESQTEITLNATGLWSAKITEGSDYLDISPSEGISGQHTITISAQANDAHAIRNGTIRFTGQENKFVTLRITQDSLPHTVDTIRFMSYNQHYGYGMDNLIDYNRVAGVINEYQPDFVAVQELDSMTTRSYRIYQLGRLATLTGMVGTYCKTIDFQGGKYGIGILSRQAPLSVRSISLPLTTTTEARRMVIAEFEHYVFCCTHFPLNATERSNAAKVITEAVADFTDKPVVIGGDFNAEPTETAIKYITQNFDMLNDPAVNTFPADTPNITIDYLFMKKNDNIQSKKIGCGVITETVASDHRPIWADVIFIR